MYQLEKYLGNEVMSPAAALHVHFCIRMQGHMHSIQQWWRMPLILAS